MFIFLCLLLVSLSIQSAKAQDLYFEYRVSWEFIVIGKIEIWKKDGQAVAYARTTGLGAFIFPFKSLWRTETNQAGEPVRTEIEVLERGQPKRKCIFFDRKNGCVIKEKITFEKHRRDTFPANFPLFDELTGFLAALSLNWDSPGQVYTLPIFAGKKTHFARLLFKGQKKIKSFRGWEKVREIEVSLPFKSELIKRSQKIRVYLSMEGLPVVVEGDIRLGHLTAYLTRVSTSGSAPPPPEALLHSVLKALD